MRKFISLLLLMGAFGYGLAQPLAIDTAWFRHVPSAHHLTYWFDNNSATAQELSLSQTSLQMDVSFLPLGVHTIHCYAVDSAGVVYPTSSAMFFCSPSIGSDSTAAQQVVYWFDQDFDNRHVSSLHSGPQLIDVSALTMGVHTLHSYVVGVDNMVYPTSSAMFFCPPSVGSDSTAAQQVVYWFDQDFDGRHFASLQSGPQLLDVSDLDIGVHTIHSYVVGIDNTVYPTTSVMFFRLPYIDTDSAEAQELVYWFDQDYANRHIAPLQAGVQMLDVSALSVGVHTLHSYVVGTDSTVYPTSSAMFFRPPSVGADTALAQEIVYWFDQDYASRQHTTMLSMTQMMDVSALSIGVHTLHSHVLGADGAVYPTTSSMFFRPPLAGSEGSNGITQYYYWINNDFTNATKVNVNPVTNPLQWYGLIPIDSIPFRSSYFHFEIDTAQQPHAYAKNTFHTLFMDDLGKFVMGDVAPFVDYHISQPVVSDTILPNTSETFPKVTNNNIKWFRLTAQTGDSLAFKCNLPCTLQLFDPTGEEVYRASGDTATHFDGTHAWHDGTYYLAVHDATYNGNSNLIVEYQRIGKFCILEYTPHSIGNKNPSQFVMSMKGNGFDHLESVWINYDTYRLNADTLFSVAITTAKALFSIHNPYPNAAYDIFFEFKDSIGYDTIVITQAFTLDSVIEGGINISFDAPAWQVKPFPIVVTVENTGNLDYSYIPFNIAFEHPELIDSISFGNFGIYYTPNVDSSNYSFGVLSNNLLGKHVDGGMMFFFIPELKAFEKKDFVLQFYCPNHARFNLYAWTGTPLELDERYVALIESSPQYNNCEQNPVITGRSIKLSPTLVSTQSQNNVNNRMKCNATEQAQNMLDACDLVENIQDVEELPNPIDRAATSTTNAVKTGITVAGIYNAVDHIGDMARLEAYGIDPSDPLYEEIANLHPPIATPAEIAGDGPLGWLMGLFDHCPEQPTPDPGTPYSVFIANPGDPNDIFGYVAESGSRCMRKEVEEIVYRIEFENDPAIAFAPAHTIIVKDTLDRSVFDLSSFRANSIKLGNKTLNFDNAQSGLRTIDMRPTINIIVQVQLQYDSITGIVTWTITSLDPISLEPTNYLQPGVLPVNIDGSGEGNVTFSIGVKPTLADGINISNKAYIIFDQEAPIATPIWTNIVDSVLPTSRIVHVDRVGDYVMMGFLGSDNRSGIWKYDLIGRTDSLDNWNIVASDIESDIFEFMLDSESSDFYVVAIDSAGNRENKTPQVEYNTSRGVVGPSVTTYQIQFVNFDNTVLCSYRLPMGATPAYLGSTPSRNADAHYSYRFRGWAPAIVPVAGNAVYRAVYDSVPVSYRICFFDYDSTLLQSDSLPYGTMPSYYGSIPTRPEVDSFVYAFVGWTPELMPVSGNADYRPVFDSMLYYQLPRYLVTFRNWNDTVLQSDSVTFGTMPHYWGVEPTREGNAYCDYRFRGWTPRLAPVTDSVVYTAEFDTMVHTYPVTFVNFNGSVLQQDTLPYGSMPVYRGNTPARRTTIQYTYTFVGWSPNIDTVRGAAVYTAVFDSVFSCISQYHYDNISTCDSVLWRGNVYATSGTYSERVEGVAYGCDSVYVLNLVVNSKSYTTDVQTSCNSYSWHGTTYTTSTNTPTFTEQNVEGCDSVVTLHLTINHNNTGTDVQTACDSYTWHNTTYTASTNTSTFTEQNMAGCDSVVTLHLTINHSNTGTDVQTACDSYTWHGTTYTASTNTPTFTEQNADGCDSVVTLHLTINHSNTGTDVQTACDSYTWHGTTYTASTNTPTFTEQNADGCDSVVTLHLTINHSNTGTDVQTACDSYTWHGTTYTASTNTPTFTEQNVEGCDSVVTLHLTVNHSDSIIFTTTACDSLLWHGSVYVSSTETPVFVTQNSEGCDSVVTLHLTINNSTTNVFDLADCDSVVWSDWTFYTSTDTNVVLTNSVGCDSLNMLHLIVNYTVQTTIVDSAQGSYDWNGQTYTESGEYTFTTQTEAGCDSIVTLILTITQTEGILFDEFEQVTLYPNPTTGKVVVNGMKVICLEVYDLDGRLVGTFMNTNSFDISQLSSGTYLVRITMPQGETIRRVIKH